MTKEIKKIGHNIELKGFVIHQVNKEANIKHTVVKHASKLLPTTDKEKAFIAKIYKSYFDNSKPFYGIFADEQPKFKINLETYRTDKDFLLFTKNSTDYYKYVLTNSAPATGGFLIFAHFENTEKKFDYMLVMTTTNKDGYMVSEADLTIKDIKNLDLSKIDVACMINLTKWENITKGLDTESLTYLSFAKGNKDISFYFMSFIDCSNKTTKAESTNRLILAVDGYCGENGFTREQKIKKRNEIFTYCNACIDNKKEIQLSSISAIMNPDNPDDFEIFAANERFSVSTIINGDRTKLKPMKYVIYQDDEMRVEFDAGLIQEGKVVFDSKKKQLTFKNIPNKLADQIPQ